MVGNLDRYMTYQTGVALEAGAEGSGGAAGAGIGMGAGLAMGQQMANQMGNQNSGQRQLPQDSRHWTDNGRRVEPNRGALPPPLPGGSRYHVAIDGQATGPYSIEGLQQQLGDGSISPQSLVWTNGMADWTEVRDVAELSELFRSPPPLPGS